MITAVLAYLCLIFSVDCKLCSAQTNAYKPYLLFISSLLICHTVAHMMLVILIKAKQKIFTLSHCVLPGHVAIVEASAVYMMWIQTVLKQLAWEPERGK